MEFLTGKMYYGNSIKQWLIAAGIVVCSVLIARLLYWVFGGVVRKYTAKTKTRLDNILVDMLEEPVVFAVAIIGIWYGLATLHMSETASRWIATGYYFLIIFTIAWSVTRTLDAIIQEYLVPLVDKTEGDLDDQLLPLARKCLKIAVWAIAAIVALNNAGYDVGALLAGLGIGGLAFALAAKDSVANLFGGFTIFMDKPFRVNDRIVVNGFDGVVEEIGIRSTRIRTLAGRLITMPNSKIVDNPVENISSEPGRKIILQLGLTYDTAGVRMEEAMGLLKDLTAEHNDIADNVSIAFSGFGDFSLNITLIYWINAGADIFKTQTDLNLAILNTFNEKGLEFAYPTQEIHTRAI